MRRAGLSLLLLAAAAPAPGGEDKAPAPPGGAPPPLVFFRDPDPETKRRIQALLSSKELGSGTRDIRTRARKEVAGVGEWTIPALCESLHGKKRDKANRVRMNVCLAMARVLERGRADSRLLDAIRGAVADDEDHWIRRAALLVLAGFEQAGDHVFLEARLENPDLARKDQEAAALALAKVGDPGAKDPLLLLLGKPDLPERNAAAYLLAFVLVAPEEAGTTCLDKLEHDSKLVRLVAATGLCLRPAAGQGVEKIAARLKVERDKFVRARLVHALAAATSDEERRREALLALAGNLDEKSEVRIAAFLALADAYGPEESYARTKRLLSPQHDAVYGAALFALARSGADAAVDDLFRVLKTGSLPHQTYAAGALGHLLAFAPARPRRERDVFRELGAAQARATSDRLKTFLGRLLDLNFEQGRAERARALFLEYPDPDGNLVWTPTRLDRTMRFVNDLLPPIFELDDLVGRPEVEGGYILKQGAASPDEVDLFDFFQEAPYFGPEDVLGG